MSYSSSVQRLAQKSLKECLQRSNVKGTDLETCPVDISVDSLLANLCEREATRCFTYNDGQKVITQPRLGQVAALVHIEKHPSVNIQLLAVSHNPIDPALLSELSMISCGVFPLCRRTMSWF
jgi:hypothetical protein